MASPAMPITVVKALDWRKYWNQFCVIVSTELKRNVFARRGLWLYFLAFAPAVIIALHAVESPMGRHCSIDQDTEILGGIIQLYYVRLGIFFGCLGVFTWLFRGEVVQKSLHYYFLAPVRREILVIGKFIAGLVSSTALFSTGVLICFIFMYGHFGPAGQNYVFDGPGLAHLRSYLLVVVLACVGYGSIFLVLGLISRNPIIPGAIVFLWEGISGVLPATLQKLSVTFYLKPFFLVQIPAKGLAALFTVVAEPVPIWLAIPGLFLMAGVMLTVACYLVRRMEISYSTE